jgi:hypothetical protein
MQNNAFPELQEYRTGIDIVDSECLSEQMQRAKFGHQAVSKDDQNVILTSS